MPKLGLEIKRKCKFCGKAFIIKTLDSIYCCKKCSEAAYAHSSVARHRFSKLGFALVGTIFNFVEYRLHSAKLKQA